MTFAGGCRCGAVRYELDSEELPLTYACHCLDCQTWSGSGFLLHAMVPEDTLKISGEAVRLRLPADAEAMPSEHIGCAACLTRIANTNSAIPGMAVLKVGTLDRSNEVTPAAHIWMSRAQPWITLDENTPIFEETPSPEAFAEAIAGE
ncbi:GFA family protein [Qipengyuania sp. GH1]|uniref:GFA family protein n=1 Tax=Qipengyuania aestuarii TaxID=2867241 RepID=UPI001C868EEB|nr:GFA family protein [Qipengyuania aestuarii]MBX7535172.1 GFA family protein [Qipengyuania aestuarii]